MPRRSTSRRRGIERGLAKHQVRKRESNSVDNDSGNKRKFWKIIKGKLCQLAGFCVEMLHKGCNKLYLLPFTRTLGGQYVRLEGRALGTHRLVACVGLLIVFQKSWFAFQYLISDDFKLETFMCLILMGIYVGTFFMASGLLLKPKETVDLMNSWPFILDCLKIITQKDVSPMDDWSTVLKISTVSVLTQVVPFMVMFFSLSFTLPVCWYPTLKSIGLIPASDNSWLSTFTWQLILAPLEWMTYAPAMLIAPFYGNVFIIGIGAIKVFTKQFKSVALTSLARRETVERLYVCLELHNRIFSIWFSFVIVPSILSMSNFVVLALFVSIRYTQLPFLFYIWFPYIGLWCMFGIFWTCYDITLTLRDAEDVLQRLMSSVSPCLRGMPKEERSRILKRAKGMRPIAFPIGSFGQFSLALPVIIWEEILNQILFLLSF